MAQPERARNNRLRLRPERRKTRRERQRQNGRQNHPPDNVASGGIDFARESQRQPNGGRYNGALPHAFRTASIISAIFIRPSLPFRQLADSLYFLFAQFIAL